MDKLKNIRILPPNNIERKVETKLHYFDTDVKDFLHKQRMVGQLEDGGAEEGQPRPSDDQVTLYAWDASNGTWSDSGFTFGQFIDTNYTGD